MGISMQGSWEISVKSIEAAWPQRIQIEGSDGDDGIYDSNTSPLHVNGSEWTITVEHQPNGKGDWISSRHRITDFRTSGNSFLFDILTDDTAGDEDFNDIILTCKANLSPWDYIVYGKVMTYRGRCLINPCFPRPYFVVDDYLNLVDLVSIKEAKEILQKIYPQRVKPVIKWPPEPDPEPFTPLMIPTGLKDEPGMNIVRSAPIAMETKSPKLKTKKGEVKYSDILVPETLPASKIYDKFIKEDIIKLARIKDIGFKTCKVKAASQVILRFMEYDRTNSERLGGPYTGMGKRSKLGITASDEQGNYVFRFMETPSMVVEEMKDVGFGESFSYGLKPDLMIQMMERLPEGVSYESAPYYNIPNIKKINICIPSEIDLTPKPCQGQRAIQNLGEISILAPGTTLHTDGTISNNSAGPSVDHAAWYSVVDLFACFMGLKKPRVEYYTIKYRKQESDGNWSSWNFVTETYRYFRQLNGKLSYEKVGPDLRSLRTDPNQSKVDTPSYLNIEDPYYHEDWQYSFRYRKLQINTAIYQPVAGAVDFCIEGYDINGEKVPNAHDEIRLFIDNSFSNGDIVYVKPQGMLDAGDCSMYSIKDSDTPFNVKFRIRDVEKGFIESYALKVYYGSNHTRDILDVSTNKPVEEKFRNLDNRFNISVPDRFFGTSDMKITDSEGYVELTVKPSITWLPDKVKSCCFSFELHSLERVTNGKTRPSWRLLWRELVGISELETQ